MNKSTMRDIDERTNLAGNSMFELLLFRLGEAPGLDKRELFGINVFKVREILVEKYKNVGLYCEEAEDRVIIRLKDGCLVSEDFEIKKD